MVEEIKKFDSVVTFGDSWPAGVELLPGEKTFGQLISTHYDSKFYNCSEPGTSNEHMLLQLDSFLKNNKQDIEKNTCAVFFLTEALRTIFWDKEQQVRCLRGIDNGIGAEVYYKHIHSNELDIFRANQCLLALQRMCQQHNLNDFYVLGWSKFPIMLSGIDLNKVYQQGNSTCLDMFKIFETDPTDDPNFIYYDYNHYIRPNQCHPNQLGHQTIANNLIKWIDQYYEEN